MKTIVERLRELENGDGVFVQDFAKTMYVEMEGLAFGAVFRKAVGRVADEIERCYIPRPRFEDGETVVKGSETDFGTVWSVGARDDGYWRLFDEDGVELCCGEKGEFVKRPTLKVCDADGVEIKVGDIVWPIDGETRFEVLEIDGIDGLNVRAYDGLDATWLMSNKLTHERPVFDAEGVRCVDGETVYHFDKVQGILPTPCVIEKVTPDGTLWWKGCAPAYMFTHREPDSLEKLRDDMNAVIAPTDIGHKKFVERLTALIERGA